MSVVQPRRTPFSTPFGTAVGSSTKPPSGHSFAERFKCVAVGVCSQHAKLPLHTRREGVFDYKHIKTVEAPKSAQPANSALDQEVGVALCDNKFPRLVVSMHPQNAALKEQVAALESKIKRLYEWRDVR